MMASGRPFTYRTMSNRELGADGGERVQAQLWLDLRPVGPAGGNQPVDYLVRVEQGSGDAAFNRPWEAEVPAPPGGDHRAAYACELGYLRHRDQRRAAERPSGQMPGRHVWLLSAA